jgi:hypothetical protein
MSGLSSSVAVRRGSQVQVPDIVSQSANTGHNTKTRVTIVPRVTARTGGHRG